MRRPTPEQFDIAILWLEANEGEEGGEKEACQAVAAFLERKTQQYQARAKRWRKTPSQHID